MLIQLKSSNTFSSITQILWITLFVPQPSALHSKKSCLITPRLPHTRPSLSLKFARGLRLADRLIQHVHVCSINCTRSRNIVRARPIQMMCCSSRSIQASPIDSVFSISAHHKSITHFWVCCPDKILVMAWTLNPLLHRHCRCLVRFLVVVKNVLAARTKLGRITVCLEIAVIKFSCAAHQKTWLRGMSQIKHSRKNGTSITSGMFGQLWKARKTFHIIFWWYTSITSSQWNKPVGCSSMCYRLKD